MLAETCVQKTCLGLAAICLIVLLFPLVATAKRLSNAEIAREIGAEQVLGDDNIAKVSVVGVGMRSHAGVAAKTFTVLAKENINIMMISTSEIKISCVIEQKYTELAVRVLHNAFELHNL